MGKNDPVSNMDGVNAGKSSGSPFSFVRGRRFMMLSASFRYVDKVSSVGSRLCRAGMAKSTLRTDLIRRSQLPPW